MGRLTRTIIAALFPAVTLGCFFLRPMQCCIGISNLAAVRVSRTALAVAALSSGGMHGDEGDDDVDEELDAGGGGGGAEDVNLSTDDEPIVGAMDADSARTFLGLGGSDSDVETYLREGADLLGRRVVIVLPPDDAAIEECMLITATKFVKLGASVVVLSDDSSAGRRCDVAKKVPYPRVIPYRANVSSTDEVTRCLAGACAVVVSASQPRLTALTTALQKQRSDALQAAGGQSDGGSDESSDMTERLGAPGYAFADSQSMVEQLVVLSSVGVYGDRQPSSASEWSDGLDEGEEAPQPADPAAAALLANEATLVASCVPNVAVLRSCAIYGVDGVDCLLSDALGLKDLLVEFIAELHAKTGLADAPATAASAAASASAAFEALLPAASCRVQMTQVDDLAGASVYAVLAALNGPYHVCSAPTTMQSIFDDLAHRKKWPTLRLRGDEGEGGDASQRRGSEAAPTYSCRKLCAAGYALLWPELTAPADQAAAPLPDTSESQQ